MEDYRKLELSWKISDFLPVSDKLGTITEYIIPELAEDMDKDVYYWNVPEILLDIRWVHEMADKPNTSFGQTVTESRIDYDKQIQRIQILTRVLQSYAFRYYKNDEKLKSLRNEKEAFIDFWGEHKKIINKVRKENQLSEEDQEKLVTAAARLLEISNSGDDKDAAFRSNLEANYSGIRDKFREILDSAEKIQQESNDTERIKFAKGLYSFYTRYLFQKEEKEAGSAILSLNQEIRQLLGKTGQKVAMPRANKWESYYREAVWNGLQQVTTQLCSGDQRIISFQNPSELVTTVTERMEDADVAKNLVRDYRKEQGERNARCIAMLDANDHTIRILALSGFLDCDDPELEEYRAAQKGYRDSRIFLEKIRQISAELNQSELAYFSSGVVDKYHYYETETSKKREYLRDVLKDRGRWTMIAENKACCERKIFAKLESENRTEDIQSGRMIIKFPPCKRCENTLNDWLPYSNNSIKLIT